MARMGHIDRDGMRNLIIIPETGVETNAVFTLLHADKYPLSIKGEIVFTGDSAPQIIIFGNNIVVKKEIIRKNEMDILEFFDIKNKVHLRAYNEMQDKGQWPKGFIPKGTTFRSQWSLTLLYKMTNAYMKIKGVV